MKTWLFFFRINIAGFALIHFLSIQPDFNDLYSYHGYVYPDIMDNTTDTISLTLVGLQGILHKIGYETLLWICRIAFPVSLLMLIAGLFTRASAIVALFLQLLLIKSVHLYEYGVDGFTTFALFYCCIFPVGRVYSLDNRLLGKRKVNDEPYLFLLKAHLSIAYFFSGFDKIIGVTWRNGEALWKVMHSHNYYSIFSLDFLAKTPFFVISCWATMILELAYGIFMNVRVTRPYWLIGIVLLHLFIALFMGLFFFSALLIILNLSAYYVPTLKPARSDL
jgi:hypothetical protein